MNRYSNYLVIDIETYSNTSLKESGLFKYVEDPDFSILLFGYAFNGEEVKVIDIARGESLPDEVIKALNDHSIVKVAHNAYFEITCLNKFYGLNLDVSDWVDTMISSYYASYPGALSEVGNLLNLEEQKDSGGKILINYFSIPCKPTKTKLHAN